MSWQSADLSLADRSLTDPDLSPSAWQAVFDAKVKSQLAAQWDFLNGGPPPPDDAVQWATQGVWQELQRAPTQLYLIPLSSYARPVGRTSADLSSRFVIVAELGNKRLSWDDAIAWFANRAKYGGLIDAGDVLVNNDGTFSTSATLQSAVNFAATTPGAADWRTTLATTNAGTLGTQLPAPPQDVPKVDTFIAADRPDSSHSTTYLYGGTPISSTLAPSAPTPTLTPFLAPVADLSAAPVGALTATAAAPVATADGAAHSHRRLVIAALAIVGAVYWWVHR